MKAETRALPRSSRTGRRHALTAALAVAVAMAALTLFRAEAFPPIIDLASMSADLTILGLDGSNAGRAVAVGDINGDTVQDLLVGAPEADPGGRANAGATYVFFGGPGLPADIDLESASADVTILGDDANDQSGFAVVADDINGDDTDDVIIGAYLADGSGNGTACGAGQVGDRCEAGETYVIYGGPSLPATIDLASTSADLTIFGVDTSDQSGLSVAGGDINDDGKDDVVIGASNGDGSGNGTSCGTGQVGDVCGAGEAYVIFGGTSLPATVDLNSTGADLTVFGDRAGGHSFGSLGESVASGDIDADGIDDLILGAPGADHAGMVYVIAGDATLPSVIDLGSVSADFAILGDDISDRFGQVAVGDINGDLVEDLIVGATGADGSGSGTSCGTGEVGDRCLAGEVYVFHGGTSFPASSDLSVASADVTVFGDDTTDWMGGSVAAGDINSDGFEDLMMGAFFADGSGSGSPCGAGQVGDRCAAGDAYVIYGSPSLPANIDLDSMSADLTVFGADALDRLGTSVGSGDINGDGVIDAIIGTPFAAPPARSNSGEVYVIYGECLDGDGDTLCDADDQDDDNDGCSDFQEDGFDQALGGLRDSQYFWDFFDVHTGLPAERDGAVSISDIGAVVARFGSSVEPPLTKEQALAEALTPPPAAPAYHAGFDRGGPIPGQNLWNLLPPDGSVSIGDIGAAVAQFGHTCA